MPVTDPHTTTAAERLADEHSPAAFAARAADITARRKQLAAQLDKLGRRYRRAVSEVERYEAAGLPLPARLTGVREDIEARVGALRYDVHGLVSAASWWRHTPEQVGAWCARAVGEYACAPPRFPASQLVDLLYVRIVPNYVLRVRAEHALLYLDVSLRDLTRATYEQLRERESYDSRPGTLVDYGAARLMRDDDPQSLHLETALGLRAIEHGERGGERRLPTLPLFLSYEWAVAIGYALGLTPVEAGA